MRFFLSIQLFAVSVCLVSSPLLAGGLTIELKGNHDDVSFVGAIYRWDPDGLPRCADGSPRVAKERAEAPKIDEPWVDFRAKNGGNGVWTIDSMPAGTYDLIIVKAGAKQRFEGWRYAPVLDFEAFFPPDAKVQCDKENEKGEKVAVDDKESLDFVEKNIRQSKHYENKVVPLYFGASYKKGQIRPKQIRTLTLLLRDAGTTLDGTSATMRFEIWQFEDRSGGYVKQKRTHVLHRVIMPKNDLYQWSWLWDKELGNINVEKTGTTTVKYAIPDPAKCELSGLLPNGQCRPPAGPRNN